MLRPYSRLRAEAIWHHLVLDGRAPALDAGAVWDAVDKGGAIFYRAYRSASVSKESTNADGEDLSAPDHVRAVQLRVQRLLAGGKIQPEAYRNRDQRGHRPEVALTIDILDYLISGGRWPVDALRQRDIELQYVEEFSARHAERAAAIILKRGGDSNVSIVVESRGLVDVGPHEARRIVDQEERTRDVPLHIDPPEDEELPDDDSDPVPIWEGAWAMLSDADLLAGLHRLRDVLPGKMRKIGEQWNLVLAELLCLIGAKRVAWGSDVWQRLHGPDPLRSCEEHNDPFHGAAADRGVMRWNHGVKTAMEAAIVGPRAHRIATGDAHRWLAGITTTERPRLAKPPGPHPPRVVFVGAGPASPEERLGQENAEPERWANEFVSNNREHVFPTYVAVCIDTRRSASGR